MNNFMIVIILSVVCVQSRAQSVNLQKQHATASKQLPQSTVKNFFHWYTLNQKRLRIHEVVDGIPGDSTKNYSINYNKVQDFLLQLKNSGYVSEIFLSDIKSVFNNADKSLKQHPIYDGPVDEIEFDIIFGIQEQNDLTENLNNIRAIKHRIVNNKCFLQLNIGKSLKCDVYLTKSNGHWLIDHYKPYY